MKTPSASLTLYGGVSSHAGESTYDSLETWTFYVFIVAHLI